MKHLIKKENNILHGTIGWSHNGKDGQYCEAGETVRIKWQPTAGWGLQEVHYTDGGGNVVAIEGGEFVMPDSAVVIGATFKRFFLSDWADNPYNPKPKQKYLTFTAGEGGASVGFCCWSEDYEPVDMGKNMQYSTDDGKTWQDYTIGVGEDNLVAIELNEGESVMFRGNNENLAYYLEDNDDYIYTKCIIDGSVAASGDVTSLLNGVGGDVALAKKCYGSMFSNCDSLTSAPALPATTLAESCYDSMFSGCTSLTSAPALPATTLAGSCYSDMFNGCTGLTTAPSLPATTLAEDCYNSMFSGCTGLTTAPSLPATTLAEYCYSNMFNGCTAITLHDVATLNNSQNTFQSNTSCASLTIHADTPPTIGSSTITGLKADCIIYVPAASVDAYKAAQYWSARSAYIQAIP